MSLWSGTSHRGFSSTLVLALPLLCHLLSALWSGAVGATLFQVLVFGLWTLEDYKDSGEVAQHSSPEPWRPLVTGVGRSTFWAELSTSHL